MSAGELEVLMVAVYGPDFREKVLVGPVATFSLAGAFEECGLTDPRASVVPATGLGLWQMMPSR